MVILEFIIALLFVCLMISLFVSWIIEIWASRINRKGRFLEEMLTKLVGNDDSTNWSARLYRHPMVESLSYKSNRLTSYIPAKVFSRVITDLIIEKGRDYSISQNKETMEMEYKEEASKGFQKDINNGISKMPESDLKRTIKLFLDKADGDSNKYYTDVEDWYNEYMLRVNYTYKRLLGKPMWILGFVIALIFNIDAIQITTHLWENPDQTKNIAIIAEELARENSSVNEIELSKAFFKEQQELLKLPIGLEYSKEFCCQLLEENSDVSFLDLLWKLFGFVLTGIIASFGAPFWYDALQKIVGLKNSVKTKTE